MTKRQLHVAAAIAWAASVGGSISIAATYPDTAPIWAMILFGLLFITALTGGGLGLAWLFPRIEPWTDNLSAWYRRLPDRKPKPRAPEPDPGGNLTYEVTLHYTGPDDGMGEIIIPITADDYFRAAFKVRADWLDRGWSYAVIRWTDSPYYPYYGYAIELQTGETNIPRWLKEASVAPTYIGKLLPPPGGGGITTPRHDWGQNDTVRRPC
jgi:hypothetical protein